MASLAPSPQTAPSSAERRTHRWSQWLQQVLTDPRVLRVIFAALRLIPVLRLGKVTVISRYDGVVNALSADQEYTIAEINASRMNRISGPFILGMDRSAAYDRESAAIRSIVKPSDLEWVRRIVSGTARAL